MPAPFDRTDYWPLDTFAFEALAVAGSAVPFTVATHTPGTTSGPPAICAVAKVEGAQIRYRTDGTNPTATVGVIADPGDVITVWGKQDIVSIRFIRTGGTSATVNVEYSR